MSGAPSSGVADGAAHEDAQHPLVVLVGSQELDALDRDGVLVRVERPEIAGDGEDGFGRERAQGGEGGDAVGPHDREGDGDVEGGRDGLGRGGEGLGPGPVRLEPLHVVGPEGPFRLIETDAVDDLGADGPLLGQLEERLDLAGLVVEVPHRHDVEGARDRYHHEDGDDAEDDEDLEQGEAGGGPALRRREGFHRRVLPSNLIFFFLIEQSLGHFKAAPRAIPPRCIIRRRPRRGNHRDW